MAVCFDPSQMASPLGEASYSAGQYACPFGSHLLLSTAEVNTYTASQWTTADGVSVGWQIAAIWLSVFALMFIARTVRLMMTERVSDDS